MLLFSCKDRPVFSIPVFTAMHILSENFNVNVSSDDVLFHSIGTSTYNLDLGNI